MSQGTASIEINADLSKAFEQVGPKLEAILTRLESVAVKVFSALEQSAGRAGQGTSAVQTAALAAAAALDQVDGGGLNTATSAADAATSATASTASAANAAAAALDQIDGRALHQATSAAGATTDATTRTAGAAATAAAALDQINGAGLDNASAAAGSAASALDNATASADSFADAAAQAATGTGSLGDNAREGGGMLGGLGDMAGGAMGKLGKLGGVAAGVVGIGSVGAVLFKGLDRLTSIENAQAKLRGLGHDAASVDAIMESALAGVKGTAYGLGDAAAVAASAVAAGIEPGESLTRTLQLVGDAASIAGVDMSSMGGIFNKVAANGKVSGDVMQQLTDQGIPALQLLSDQLGVSAADVSKMVSDGKVDFATFQEAIEAGMGGAALEAGGTFSGAVDNMGASLGRLGAAVLEGPFNAAPALIGKLTDGVDWATNSVKDLFSAFSGGGGGGDLPGWLSGITDAVRPIGDVFETTVGAVQMLWGAFSGKGSDADIDSGLMNQMINLGSQLRDTFDKVIGTAKQFWAGTLQPILTDLAGMFQRVFVEIVLPYLKNLWEVIQNNIIPTILRFYQDVWLPAFTKMGELVKALWDGILHPIFGFLIDVISNVVAPVVMWLWREVVGPAFEGIGLAISIAWTVISPIMDLLIAVIGNVGNIFSWLWDQTSMIFGWIGDLFSTWWSGVKVYFGFWKDGFDLMVDAVLWLWDQVNIVLDWIRGAWDGFIGFFTGLPGRIAGIASGMWDSIKTAANVAKDWVTGKWDDLIGFVTELPGKITTAVSGMWDGVKESFKSALNWIVDKWNNFKIPAIELMGKQVSPEINFPDLPRFAAGGGISGPGTGTSDDVLMWGSNGEHMWTAKEVDAAGGHAAVEGLRAAALSRTLPAFADGGPVGAAGALSGGSGGSSDVVVELLRQIAANIGDVGGAPVSLNVAGGDGASLPDLSTALPDLGAFGGGIAAAATDVIDPALTGMTANLDAFGASFPAVNDTIVQPTMAAMGAGILAAKTTLIDPALAGMSASLTATGTATTTMVQATVLPQWTAMGAGILATKTGTVDPALAGIQGGLTVTGTAAVDMVQGVVLPQFSAMGAGILDVKTGTIDPVFAGIQGGLITVQDAFANGATAIGSQWDRVREATAAPVRFAITSVFNDGIVGMWNSVSDLLGTDRMAAYPLNFAAGGRVPGTGDKDSVPAMLMPDEFVASRPMLAAIGGGSLDRGLAMMETVRQRAGSATSSLGAEGLFSAVAGRYSAGGVVQGTPAWEQLKKGHAFAQKWSGSPYVWGGSFGPNAGTDCSGYMSSIADVILGGTGLQRQWATGSFPGGGGSQGASGPQGFVQGLGAGMAIGVSTGHTAGTMGGIDGLPTVNIESGGSPSLVKYGAGAAGADHSQFPSRYHLPISDGAFVSAGSYGGAAISFGDIVGAITGPAREKLGGVIGGWPIGGMIDTYPGKMADTLTTAVDTKIDQLIEELSTFDDPGGSGVERWRPLVQLMLQRYDLGLEHTDRTLRRMNQESSGDPRAINLTDSNAAAGHPSKGLMQVIDPTFQTNRDPMLSPDIWDPMANVGASMRYAIAQYGNLPAAYDRAGGYHAGGVLPAGEGWWHKTALEPERVLSPGQNEMFEQLVGGLTRGKGGVQVGPMTVGTSGNMTINPDMVRGGSSTSDIERLVTLLAKGGYGKQTTIHAPFTVKGGESGGRAVHDQLLSLIN